MSTAKLMLPQDIFVLFWSIFLTGIFLWSYRHTEGTVQILLIKKFCIRIYCLINYVVGIKLITIFMQEYFFYFVIFLVSFQFRPRVLVRAARWRDFVTGTLAKRPAQPIRRGCAWAARCEEKTAFRWISLFVSTTFFTFVFNDSTTCLPVFFVLWMMLISQPIFLISLFISFSLLLLPPV